MSVYILINLSVYDLHTVAGMLQTAQFVLSDVGIQNKNYDLFFSTANSALEFLTVHFHEQLIQRILLLAVAAKTSSAALPADGINLINEQNARRVLARHRKHITNLTDNGVVHCWRLILETC